MSKNILFYFILFLSFLAFCTGAFYEASIDGSGKTQLMTLLSDFYSKENNYNFGLLFFPKVKDSLIIWSILFICPIIPLLAVIPPIFAIIKGLAMGFSATMIVESFGYKGIFYVIACILPQGLLQLPIICILSAFSMELSICTFKYYIQRSQRKKNKNALLTSTRHYVLVFIVGLFSLIISCLIEVYLMQFLL